MKLYGHHRTRSFRPLWLLEELQLDYEIQEIDVFQGGGRDPVYRQLNPLGKVPTLDDNGLIIYEAGAICMYLTDQYGEHLAPAFHTSERALYYQWMFYVPATLEPALMSIFLHTQLLPEAKRIERLVKQGKLQFKKIAKVLDFVLQDQTYLLGEQFSTADIMLAATLQWFPELLQPFQHLCRYTQTLSERPAYLAARQKEC